MTARPATARMSAQALQRLSSTVKPLPSSAVPAAGPRRPPTAPTARPLSGRDASPADCAHQVEVETSPDELLLQAQSHNTNRSGPSPKRSPVSFGVVHNSDGSIVPVDEGASSGRVESKASDNMGTSNDHPLADVPSHSINSASGRRNSEARRRIQEVETMEAFMESSDDEVEDKAVPEASADAAEPKPLIALSPETPFTKDRRPTAKPSPAGWPLSEDDGTPRDGKDSSDHQASGSLFGMLRTEVTVPQLSMNDDDSRPSSRASSRSMTRRNKHQVLSDWGRSRSATRAPSISMSPTERDKRTRENWRRLSGYMHVKTSVRRWRQKFIEKSGLRRTLTMNGSSIFKRDEVGVEQIITQFDDFEWLENFQCDHVTFRGTPLESPFLHISTSHLHFTTDGAGCTVRLADVLQIVPTTGGLRLRVAPVASRPAIPPFQEIRKGSVVATSRSGRRMSLSAWSTIDEDEVIEVETPEGNDIALRIFMFQSRILRSYATSLTKTLSAKMARTLHVVHFNDVYHLPPFKPAGAKGVVGGASRFHTVLKEIRETYNPLVLFSGDFMGPSLMSVITKGKQMIDAMNFLGVHYGCYGNHEFDYGLKTLKEVIFGYTHGKHIYTGSQTTWIMSNMTEGDGDQPLGGAKPFEICTWNGVRVGLLGLCENWIPQCNQLRPGEAKYHDIFEAGESMAVMLKSRGCEIVIALTHNRLNMDKELMQRCPSIDFLLGGHDHFYKSDPKNRVLKSGQEFEYLSFVEFPITEEGKVGRVRIDTRPITHETPQSDYMKGLIERYDKKMKEKLGKVIGTSPIPLDSTEETIRFREGLLPNFILDIMQDEAEADFAVLGAAAIAGKEVKPPGPVTIGDVFGWFPNDTRIMTMRLKGRTVRQMLDVMVRELPAEAPSFPHPSRALSFTINMIFTPPRVVDVCVNGKPIVDDREYVVAVEEFVGVGKAKYKFVPKEGEVVVNEENAVQLVQWVMDWFTKHKGKEKSPEFQAREEALKTVRKVVAHAARIEIDADVEKSQRFVRSVITELLQCDRGSVFLVEPNGDLSFVPDGSPDVIRIPRGRGIAAQVALTNTEFNIEDVYEDPNFNRDIDKRTGYRTRSMLALPVCLVDDKVVAVVQAINKNPEVNNGIFDEVDRLKLRLLGEQVGFQLRNSEIFRQASFEGVSEDANADSQLSATFDAFSATNFTRLTDHIISAYKGFAGEVNLNVRQLLDTIVEYAVRLIPCDAAKVFIRSANDNEIITLVDDVEDDEQLVAWEVDDGTTLDTCLKMDTTVRIHNARDTYVTTRERGGLYQTAMATSMATSEGDVVGCIVWFNRREDQVRAENEQEQRSKRSDDVVEGTPRTQRKRFSEVDEFAGRFFGQFAAVSFSNTMRLQNLDELRAEMNLQAVPELQLGRIKIRGGWATVRRLRKEIPEVVAKAERQKRFGGITINDEAAIVDFSPSGSARAIHPDEEGTTVNDSIKAESSKGSARSPHMGDAARSVKTAQGLTKMLMERSARLPGLRHGMSVSIEQHRRGSNSDSVSRRGSLQVTPRASGHATAVHSPTSGGPKRPPPVAVPAPGVDAKAPMSALLPGVVSPLPDSPIIKQDSPMIQGESPMIVSRRD